MNSLTDYLKARNLVDSLMKFDDFGKLNSFMNEFERDPQFFLQIVFAFIDKSFIDLNKRSYTNISYNSSQLYPILSQFIHIFSKSTQNSFVENKSSIPDYSRFKTFTNMYEFLDQSKIINSHTSAASLMHELIVHTGKDLPEDVLYSEYNPFQYFIDIGVKTASLMFYSFNTPYEPLLDSYLKGFNQKPLANFQLLLRIKSVYAPVYLDRLLSHKDFSDEQLSENGLLISSQVFEDEIEYSFKIRDILKKHGLWERMTFSDSFIEKLRSNQHFNFERLYSYSYAFRYSPEIDNEIGKLYVSRFDNKYSLKLVYKFNMANNNEGIANKTFSTQVEGEDFVLFVIPLLINKIHEAFKHKQKWTDLNPDTTEKFHESLLAEIKAAVVLYNF